MMKLARRRKATTAELKRDQLRQARVDAPTLRQLLPDASHVWIKLAFDADVRLVPAPRMFTVYPSAQAHFVYPCPFGDCDGSYDLNSAVFAMLLEHTCLVSGSLQCTGHKARRDALGPMCGLGAAYSAGVRYDVEQLLPAAHAAPAP